jgi:hypothetical protein
MWDSGTSGSYSGEMLGHSRPFSTNRAGGQRNWSPGSIGIYTVIEGTRRAVAETVAAAAQKKQQG